MLDKQHSVRLTTAIVGSMFIGLTFASLPVAVGAAEIESSIARGGRLYDKWYSVIEANAPKMSHPAYPASGKKQKAKDNWRCKECHGWDTLGKDGAYAKGSHFSGIKGVNGMAGADTSKIIAVLNDDTHGYGGKLSSGDLTDVANFVSKANVNYDDYIDRGSKKVKGGNATKGEAYFNTLCAQCHGFKGTKPKNMKKTLAKQMGNPWEVMHKILNGQPDEEMPALLAIDRQVVLDLMSHIATLPTEK